MINLKRGDVLRNQTVTPGWYEIEVKGMTVKPSAGDGSSNFNYELVITAGQYLDTPLKNFLINEKGLYGAGQAFFVAAGMPKEILEKLKSGEETNVQLDETSPVGKKMRAYVANTKFENRISNEATDFMPLNAVLPGQPVKV